MKTKLSLVVFLLLAMTAFGQRSGRQCKTQAYDPDHACYYVQLVPSNFHGLSFCSCTVRHTPGTCFLDGVEDFNEAVDPGDVVCTSPCGSTNVCGRSAAAQDVKSKDKTVLPKKF